MKKENLEELKKFEGCSLVAYRDAKGVLTIGYGFTSGVKYGDTITQKQADERLLVEVAAVERQITKLPLLMSANQIDALTSFAYNLGVATLKRATFYKYILQGRTKGEIRKQWLRWKYCNGKPLKGLLKRRKWECELFLSDYFSTDLFEVNIK